MSDEFIQRKELRLCCVSYTDNNSIGSSAYEDLLLGHKHSVVSCNAAAFGSSNPGDRVIIVAPNGKQRYAVLGRIQERLFECTLWLDKGGMLWNHNYIYEPLTELFEITPEIKRILEASGDRHRLNERNFFHPRFCSALLNKIADDLIDHLAKKV